jgi:xylulokinase
MAAGLTGGATLGWVRTVLGVGWPEVYAAARRGPRIDDPVFLPHLIGERTPYMDTHLRGSWSGLSAHHDRAALLFAALEGVAFATAAALDALPGVPLSGRSLRLAGGGTTDPAWRALLADVLDAELDAVDVPDSSARGAALLGARAGGLITRSVLEAAAAPRTTRIAAPGANAELLHDRRALYLDTLWALRSIRSAP